MADAARLRATLAEQDLDDARRATNRAIEAVDLAEDALAVARSVLQQARATEMIRKLDLDRLHGRIVGIAA